MKKVTFQSETKWGEHRFPRPIPAYQSIPEWYKETPLRINNASQDLINSTATGSNLTIKGCVPFLDSMTAGYIYTTPCDLEINLLDGKVLPKWIVDFEPIGSHSQDQAGSLPKESKSHVFPFKWHTTWVMKTPPGYSTLFTHPINRNDLSFKTFSGIVDTDKLDVATNFPFFLKDAESYPYVIPAGTPVAQAIPFKREKWNSEYLEPDEDKYEKAYAKIKSKISRSYRNQIWEKKTYR